MSGKQPGKKSDEQRRQAARRLEEQTFDEQAPASRPAHKKKARRGRDGGGAGPSDGDSGSSSWESDEGDDAHRGDDPRMPLPDDMVRMRDGAALPADDVTRFLVGTVLHPDDEPDLIHRDPELYEVVVQFPVPTVRGVQVVTKVVDVDALQLVDRPLSAGDAVHEYDAAAKELGRSGRVDECTVHARVQHVELPMKCYQYFPGLKSKEKARRRAEAARAKAAAAAVDGGAAAEDEEDVEEYSSGDDERAAAAAKKMRQDGRGFLSKLTTRRKAKPFTVNFSPMVQEPLGARTAASYDAFSAAFRKVSYTQLLPLDPFRRDACVVHRQTKLISYVTKVSVAAIVVLDDGAVVFCRNTAEMRSEEERQHPEYQAKSEFETEINDEPHRLLCPGSRLSFTTAQVRSGLVHYIFGAPAPKHQEGTIAVCVPWQVHAMEPLADEVAAYHPEDLVVLDFFYPEFCNVMQPVLVREFLGDGDEAGSGGGSSSGDDGDDGDGEELYDAGNPAASPNEAASVYALPDDAAAGGTDGADSGDGDDVATQFVFRGSTSKIKTLRGALSCADYNAFVAALYIPPALRALVTKKDRTAADAKECFALWGAYLQGVAPFLDGLCLVRETGTDVDVLWEDGSVTEVCALLLSAGDAPEEGFMPLEAVVPARVRQSGFPIRFPANGIVENCPQFDVEPLRSNSDFDVQVADIVTLLTKDDYRQDIANNGPRQEPPEVIGRIFSYENGDQMTCRVGWHRTPPAPTAETLPDLSVPSPEQRAAMVARRQAECDAVGGGGGKPAPRAIDEVYGEFRVGLVLRLLDNSDVIVRWWDGAEERINCQCLLVHNFPEQDDEHDDDDDDDDDDDGEESEDNSDAVGDGASGASPPLEDASGAASDEEGEKAPAVGVMGRLNGMISSVVSRITRAPAESAAESSSEAGSADEVDEQLGAALEEIEIDVADAPNGGSPDAAPTTGDAADADVDSEVVVAVPGRFECCSVFTEHVLRSDTFSPSEPKRFYKRVQQEWKQLRQSTPPDVIVKVSEDELHLLKIAITGGMHTPYYQGMFCFDLQFSPNYPHAPPTLHFHHKRFRMNPNLYDNGYVCLSLLGTWEGTASCEQWNPVLSNVGQIILSVQAMILNKEPWYNEPGFEAHAGTHFGRVRSKAASESYYLMKLQHLLEMARAPPHDWTYEFRAHFLKYVPELLRRARQYVADGGSAKSSPVSEGADGADDARGGPVAAAKINCDGLVMPLSVGLLSSLQRHVAQLEAAHARLSREWEAEHAANEAAFVGSDAATVD
jgi:ubiquitin-conjugating enzyme E2 O